MRRLFAIKLCVPPEYVTQCCCRCHCWVGCGCVLDGAFCEQGGDYYCLPDFRAMFLPKCAGKGLDPSLLTSALTTKPDLFSSTLLG